MFQGPPCLASIFKFPGYSDRPKADVLALSLYKAGGMVDEWAKLAPSSLSLGGGFKY